MSEFNLTNEDTLKQAFEGKPLRTRDGRKAYVVSSFKHLQDKLDISIGHRTHPLLVLVQNKQNEFFDTAYLTVAGQNSYNSTSGIDLVGWYDEPTSTTDINRDLIESLILQAGIYTLIELFDEFYSANLIEFNKRIFKDFEDFIDNDEWTPLSLAYDLKGNPNKIDFDKPMCYGVSGLLGNAYIKQDDMDKSIMSYLPFTLEKIADFILEADQLNQTKYLGILNKGAN